MSEFDNIIGYSDIKLELAQICDVLKNPTYYKGFGIPQPKALLLYGVPGVGKTLMASCFLKESGREFLVCRKDHPEGKFVEEIKKTFEKARERAPSIILLDDLDKFSNMDHEYSDTEEYITVQSCMDEIGDAQVFVLATANSIKKLPESLLRAGRFGRRIEVETPSQKDSKEIIQHFLKERKIAADWDMDFVVKVMHGHSCAELEEVLNIAGIYAGFARKDTISLSDFVMAVVRLFHNNSFSKIEDADMSDAEKASLKESSYHEAAHVVVADILDRGSVTLAFLNAQVNGGGFVSCDYTISDPFRKLECSAIVGLAGTAATEIVLGTSDLGNSDDLQNVFISISAHISNNCICRKFHLHEPLYGGFSEAYQHDLENETASMISRYYEKAIEIIVKNREYLEKVANELIERKILTMDDIAQIRETCHIVPCSF